MRQEWQPIETAPTNTSYANPIDLWLVNGLRAWREPNCHEAHSEKGTWLDSRGKWVTGGRFYDADGDECFSPRPLDGHKAHARATHWMPPPKPPSTSPSVEP